MSARPWKIGWTASLTADMYREMLSLRADGLPDQKKNMEGSIRRAADLSGGVKDAAITYLSTLPNGDRLCPRGPLVIDWMTVSRGNPTGEIARSFLIMGTSALPSGTPPLIRPFAHLAKKLFFRAYRRRIFRLFEIRQEDIDAWMLPLAAARLSEWPPKAEKRELLGIVERGMKALKPRASPGESRPRSGQGRS